jgi:hypothetical protein
VRNDTQFDGIEIIEEQLGGIFGRDS